MQDEEATTDCFFDEFLVHSGRKKKTPAGIDAKEVIGGKRESSPKAVRQGWMWWKDSAVDMGGYAGAGWE